MKILITGATGLVGSAIVNHCLAKKYTVHFLTTSRTKIVNQDNYKGFYWNPTSKEIDAKCLDGVHTIINLAGASISKRWTASHKKEMLDSRVNSVALLYKLLSENNHNVSHIISASALGIYPSSLHKKYEEDSNEVSTSFLGEVVHKWENEVDTLRALDLKISKVRIGIVLSKNGGALTAMLKPIKLGAGATLGTGNQFQSWVHIEDLAALFVFIAEKKLAGVFNGVASNPVTNKVMTSTIAKQLKKPLWLPKVPTFVLQLILGEMAALVLESQYLQNDKIKKQGFQFTYETIEEALQECLN
tara:strand:+ start:43414 stop:44319 length:906 start_codon:yes stop_codon:yes gene_type:complete